MSSSVRVEVLRKNGNPNQSWFKTPQEVLEGGKGRVWTADDLFGGKDPWLQGLAVMAISTRGCVRDGQLKNLRYYEEVSVKLIDGDEIDTFGKSNLTVDLPKLSTVSEGDLRLQEITGLDKTLDMRYAQFRVTVSPQFDHTTRQEILSFTHSLR